jgi:peptidoglycan/LPS O-acetylase OafA/YrhL
LLVFANTFSFHPASVYDTEDYMKKISFLDGLRGTAAVVVVISHFVQVFYPSLFTLRPEMMHNQFEAWLSKTPFNLFYNGNFSVCIFFVLSGFVLSYKYWETRRVDVVIESTVKRYFRLVLPVFFSILLVYIILLLNGFSLETVSPITYTDMTTHYHALSHDFVTMVRTAFFDTFFLGNADYNPVLWTMNYELIGSYLIFAMLIVCRDTPYRYVAYLLLIYMLRHSYYLAFVLGLLLCDVYHNHQRTLHVFQKPYIPLLTGILGLYMGSYPYIDTSNTIYALLDVSFMGYDPMKFNHVWGAFFLMIAILASTGIQKILSSPICVFLGNISFSLYLLHFTILCSVSGYIFSLLNGSFSYNVSVCISFLLSFPLMMVGSYLMYRYIDTTSIFWAKKFYLTLFRKQVKPPRVKKAYVQDNSLL